MIENKKVITWSLIVLFLSLSIVYSLTYQKKEKLFKNSSAIKTEHLTNNESLDNRSQELDTNIEWLSNWNWVISLWNYSQTSWVNNSNTKSSSKSESSTSASLASTNVKWLPGTTEYFGVLDIVSILWEKPQYTLQDERGNYFAYYGNHLDFVQTVQLLGGNVYEMVTESEILQNQLFGDKVSYINLSTFKDVRVLMVVEIDGDVRLLQIPSESYHYSKDYLRSLFIQ